MLSVPRDPLRQSLSLATTDAEMAVCRPFVALVLEPEGDRQRAAQFLALAFHYPHVAKGWVGRLPEIASMRPELAGGMSPADFSSAWEQGQTMNIQSAITEARQLLSPETR